MKFWCHSIGIVPVVIYSAFVNDTQFEGNVNYNRSLLPYRRVQYECHSSCDCSFKVRYILLDDCHISINHFNLDLDDNHLKNPLPVMSMSNSEYVHIISESQLTVEEMEFLRIIGPERLSPNKVRKMLVRCFSKEKHYDTSMLKRVLKNFG